MLTLNDGRAELWQWDTGRKLTVDADCSQVHFSNKVFGRSIDVDVVDGTAIIPDILLQTDKDLNVWAFVGTDENGYTKISKTFKVNRRNKPADYVFTPVEQTTIAEIAAIAQSVRDDADAGLFNGTRGSDGGYYTPAVTQPNANTMRLSFSPSKEGMPAVAEKDITLPSGGGGGGSGGSGEDGGYYTPAVTQTAENTMQVVFTPSKATMPAVSGTEITLPDGPRGADGKSAYQYAQDGGYTGTEAEFAAKLAEELPDKLPNPNALTFTGAVTGSYDGSEAKTISIPSGGGSISLPLLYDLTTSEEVVWIDTGDNAFLAKNFLIVEMKSVASETNESDKNGSASMYPFASNTYPTPWANEAVAKDVDALLPKTYEKTFRAFSFRGNGGFWTSVTSIRNNVNTTPVIPKMVSSKIEGVTDQPIRGIIIGSSYASSVNVFGVGSRLRVWGI